jgi:hypothetical protein
LGARKGVRAFFWGAAEKIFRSFSGFFFWACVGALPGIVFPNSKIGIFFSDNGNKGVIMAKLLSLYFPSTAHTKAVVLVDDTLSKCLDAHKALDAFGANAFIFHYTKSQSLITYQQMLFQFAQILPTLF